MILGLTSLIQTHDDGDVCVNLYILFCFMLMHYPVSNCFYILDGKIAVIKLNTPFRNAADVCIFQHLWKHGC